MRRWPVVVFCLMAGTAFAGAVELVSRAARPGGGQTGGGNSSTAGRSLSTDGRYLVFSSSAPNLVSGMALAHSTFGSDIYLFDRVAGATSLVSFSATGPGVTGNGPADSPAISTDGRWIAYASNATDVVSGVLDVNQTTDVFLYDRTSGAVVLVSHSVSFPLRSANGLSSYPSVSADGRWVAFSSLATDLLPGQSGSPTIWNVYLWDRNTSLIALASHAAGSLTTPGNANSGIPLVSADGSTVVFSSQAPNLAPAAGSSQQIYAFDRASGGVRLVSHAAGLPGTGGSGWSVSPDVSADGRFVSFETNATNIVPGQTGSGSFSNVFLWDGSSGTSVLASHAAGSPVSTAGGSSRGAVVSADGRYVAYSSDALDVMPGFVDGNTASADVFLFDRVSDVNALVSRRVGTTTTGGSGDSSASAISGDGSRIVFSSLANDLISGLFDLNADSDVFVFDRVSGTTTLASHLPGSPLSSANRSSGGSQICGDGAFVVYQTLSTDLFGPSIADHNGLGDLALFDVNGGTNVLVSQAALDTPCLSAAGGSQIASNPRARAVSADGRYVVFESEAGDLVAGQVKGNFGLDVFLADRWAGTSSLVSHIAGAPEVNGSGGDPALSGDGRWTAFTGLASLVAGVPAGALQPDVLLYDRLAGVNTLVSHGAGALAPANGRSYEPVMSADGNWIAFTSSATDLVAGVDGNLGPDVFLYDRVGDTVSLVSHHAGAPTTAANSPSLSPSISADGSIVTFISSASDLTPGETGGGLGAVYAYLRASGSITLVSHAAGLPSQRANSGSANASVSGDGLWVAYESSGSDLAAGQVDTNNVNDVFLWDRVANQSILASHTAGNPAAAGNSGSEAPSLSDDGRFLAFSSFATDLVPAAGAAPGNVYMLDRAAGTVRLVSATPAGQAAGGVSYGPILSADGGRVAFFSNATDLVAGFAAPPFPTMQRFLFSRASGTVQLATGAASSATVGSNAEGAFKGALSADGNVFAFCSFATDLVPGDFNGSLDVFAFRAEFIGHTSAFSPLTPCRVADTREAAGPWGAPSLAANSSRSIVLAGRCGIPAVASAVSMNITAVNPTADGALNFSPAGFPAGGTSFLSFRAGQTRANNAILGLGASGATTVDVAAPGPLDLVIDVNGYFK